MSIRLVCQLWNTFCLVGPLLPLKTCFDIILVVVLSRHEDGFINDRRDQPKRPQKQVAFDAVEGQFFRKYCLHQNIRG